MRLPRRLRHRHTLKLVAPGDAPTRVWDEAIDDFRSVTAAPVEKWRGQGHFFPILASADATPGDVGGQPDELPTYRAYLDDTDTVRAALATPAVTLVDAEPTSLTYQQIFKILRDPQAVSGQGRLRLELREAS